MPSDLFSALLVWRFDPAIILTLGAGTYLYARGWRRLHRNGHATASLPTWRAWCYAGGLIAVALALLSPLDTYDALLFSVHMTQHLTLILIAAPLLLLGAPVLPILWGLPKAEREGLAIALFSPRSAIYHAFHYIAHPVVALLLFVGTIAVWHVPAFYDAAQGPTPIHDLEHFTFFATALLYWWQIIHPSGSPRRVGYGAAIFYLLPSLMEGVVIGAVLTFAALPIYNTYLNAPRVSPLSALEDQQLGGLIMWIPSGLVYLLALFCLLTTFVQGEEERAREADLQADLQALEGSTG